jgi:flagella basal body P-ring formation protein FlgA
MMFLAPFALASCLTLPPQAANVTAADLHLDGVPPETVLSFAPAPGVQRIFQLPELRRIAARFPAAKVPENDICVQRAMFPLNQAKLLEAMQNEIPGAKIEITEFSKQLAPEGKVEFRRTGLRNSTALAATWFGSVLYAPNRQFTIWAKVVVTVHVPRVVALVDLPAGKPIAPTQIELQTHDEFPSIQPLAETAEEAIARYPRTLIRKGTAIRRDALEAPKDVRQGDIVEVEVMSGGAHLKFEARAENSGAIGETIAIQNPVSSKRFQAKIDAKGKVSVQAPILP